MKLRFWHLLVVNVTSVDTRWWLDWESAREWLVTLLNWPYQFKRICFEHSLAIWPVSLYLKQRSSSRHFWYTSPDDIDSDDDDAYVERCCWLLMAVKWIMAAFNSFWTRATRDCKCASFTSAASSAMWARNSTTAGCGESNMTTMAMTCGGKLCVSHSTDDEALQVTTRKRTIEQRFETTCKRTDVALSGDDYGGDTYVCERYDVSCMTMRRRYNEDDGMRDERLKGESVRRWRSHWTWMRNNCEMIRIEI
jgi:hypothetical protein